MILEVFSNLNDSVILCITMQISHPYLGVGVGKCADHYSEPLSLFQRCSHLQLWTTLDGRGDLHLIVFDGFFSLFV